MKAIGYDVLVDADVDYGDDLNGFMRRATECRHVLLVIDENYVIRADTLPGSGVGVENSWVRGVYAQRPASWLSVLYKDNRERRLPAWMAGRNPKGHSFGSQPDSGAFPGSEQVEASVLDRGPRRPQTMWFVRRSSAPGREGWRRLTVNATPTPGAPRPGGRRCLRVREVARQDLLAGLWRPGIPVPRVRARSVLDLRLSAPDPRGWRQQVSQFKPCLRWPAEPRKTIVGNVGDQIILQNTSGALCLVDLLAVNGEITKPKYVPASVRFRFEVLRGS